MSPPETLGDVLYTDKTRVHPQERDWVALVQSMAGGDQVALHALYDRSHRVVFTLIMRIVGNQETAEELTLDVFHDVWRKAESYDPASGTVVAWVMNQARSRAIDRLRYEQRKKRVAPLEADFHAAKASDEMHDSLESLRQGETLRHALSVLTPDERLAIETAYFNELSYAETAMRLDLPLGTIKTRIRNGLFKLRQALAMEKP